MPTTLRAVAPLFAFAAALLVPAPAAAQDGPARKGPKGATWEQDEYEEKVIQKAAERAVKAADTEAGRWLRELTKAFPGQVAAAQTEEQFGKWFDLLAADGREWRRDASPSREVAGLFDRAAQRLELGPVPSIRRDEFLKFARHALVQKNPQPQKPAERYAEADRAFRVLDRDGSGALEWGEWTERLRADQRQADADGNRRIDPDEYRAYFEGRVSEAVEAMTKAAAGPGKGGQPGAGRAAAGLPAWFKELDTDSDGQVGLYEWRAAGRPVEEFQAMDLNGDGLLTADEYQRYVRAAEGAAEPARTPPQPDRGPDGKKAKR